MQADKYNESKTEGNAVESKRDRNVVCCVSKCEFGAPSFVGARRVSRRSSRKDARERLLKRMFEGGWPGEWELECSVGSFKGDVDGAMKCAGTQKMPRMAGLEIGSANVRYQDLWAEHL